MGPHESNGFQSIAVEALHEKDPALLFGEVGGDARPDEFPRGVVHPAGDRQTLGTAFPHHLLEEERVQLRRGVCYGEARVSIAVRFNF